MFVIIHKIIWLYITGIMLGDLEMQPLVPKCKHGEVAGGFSTLPRTSAYQGFRLEKENSLHQGDSHHSHFLTHQLQRTSWRGKIYPLRKHCSIPHYFQVQTPTPTVWQSKSKSIPSEMGVRPVHTRKDLPNQRGLCGDPKCQRKS